ncbi:MAG: hypothetical protein QXH80_02835, partial [Candidatus Nanoarchaeia archaeon]
MFINLESETAETGWGSINVTWDNLTISAPELYEGVFSDTSIRGIYNATFIAIDNYGAVNDTEQTYFNITEVNDAPTVPYILSPAPGDIISGTVQIQWSDVYDEEGDSLQYNITLLNPDYSENATIVTNYGNASTTSYDWDTTVFQDGNYSLKVVVFENETAEGLSSYSIITGAFSIDNTPPAIEFVPPTETSGTTINRDYIQINITADDEHLDYIEVFLYNSTGDLINQTMGVSSPYFVNFTDMDDGLYYFNATAYDMADNYNYTETRNVTILTKTASTCSLAFNPSSPQTYGTAVNASCSCTNPEAEAKLYRNGTDITATENNVYTVLPAGSWYYVCNVSETQNYTSASNSSTYVINKAATYVNLSLNGVENNVTVTYPQTITAVFSTNLLSATMYRNGSDVSSENNTPVTLTAGYWNYTVINPGNENYTESSKTFFATVNKAASEVNLLLNGADSNITIEAGTSVNHTAAMVTPIEGYVEIYKNNNIIASGSAPTTNISTYNAAGTYNITAIYNETENYTSSYETHFITVQDTTAPTITSTTIEPYDPAVGYNITLNASATDNGELSGTFANITLPNSTTITIPMPANYTIQVAGRHNITFWANDSAGNIGTAEDYFIAGTTLVSIVFNTVDYNFSGIPVNLTIYFTGTDKQVHLHEFNGTKLDNHTNILYDLYYRALSGNVDVKLNAVNLSLDNNDTLGLDRLTNVTGYLVVYGIYSTYNITNATLIISYAGTGYADENSLSIYRCADWNFTARTCAGSWESISATQDTAQDTFTITTSGFSAFAVKQGSYCGDGTCDAGESCSSCPEDCGICAGAPGGGGGAAPSVCSELWNCSDWGACMPDGKQYRYCWDLNKCDDLYTKRIVSYVKKAQKPAEAQDCIYEGTCDDGIKNGNEEDIDCGGRCKPCIVPEKPPAEAKKPAITLISAGKNIWDFIKGIFKGIINFIIDICTPELKSADWSNAKTIPESQVGYIRGASYSFSVEWKNVKKVIIEHDFSGNLANYSVTARRGNEWYYEWRNLEPGSYVWKEYGLGKNGKWVATEQWTYVIAPQKIVEEKPVVIQPYELPKPKYILITILLLVAFVIIIITRERDFWRERENLYKGVHVFLIVATALNLFFVFYPSIVGYYATEEKIDAYVRGGSGNLLNADIKIYNQLGLVRELKGTSKISQITKGVYDIDITLNSWIKKLKFIDFVLYGDIYINVKEINSSEWARIYSIDLQGMNFNSV